VHVVLRGDGQGAIPGGNTADKIRRHLARFRSTRSTSIRICRPVSATLIAAMMDKNPDKRTPTASRWSNYSVRGEMRTQQSIWRKANPPGSGIFYRGGAPAPPHRPRSMRRLSYVLDDLDFPPGQVESPSQISQGTVSVASETEDTLAGVPALRRSAPVVRTAPQTG